jgi:hypothetical protein
MSGRLSSDQNPAAWAYGALPQYTTDGTPLTPSHGRRSSIYRAQNSTLFNAFEEGENMPLSDLQEEDEDSGDDRDRDRNRPGRSLVGNGNAGGKGRREEEGGRHPAYAGED